MTGLGSSNVPDHAGDGAGVTRRNAMNMMTALAAVPAVGLPAGALALVTTDRSAWDSALARYQHAKSTFDRLWEEASAAEESWDAACPREARYFDKYNLGIGMNRERAFSELRYQLCQRAGINGLVISPPQRRKECEAKLDAIGKEAERIADEFMTYQQRHADTKRSCRVEETTDAAHDYGEQHFFPSREALMRLPAPDQAALLVKMEISTRSLDDEHAESTLADARRLLSGGGA